MKKEVIISEGSKSQSMTNSFSQGRIPPHTSRNSQFLGKGKLILSHICHNPRSKDFQYSP